MAHELVPISSSRILSREVLSFSDSRITDPLLCELGGGVLRFVDAAFPGVDRNDLLAQNNDREPGGRGAHFDVYQNYINTDYPWIGLFNLTGSANMRCLPLPEDLAASYLAMYPDPSDEAFEARRNFSAIALNAPNVDITNSRILPGRGVIFPQPLHGPHIIHDIVPDSSSEPGRYVKFVVPADTKEARKRMREGNYLPLDELLTQVLGGFAVKKGTGMTPRLTRATTRRDTQGPSVGWPTIRVEDPERHCNLD